MSGLQLVFSVTDSNHNIIYASTNSKERDDWYEERGDNTNLISYIVADLDGIAKNIWDRLDALEKLSLERVDCCIWREKALSKYSL